MQGEAIQQYHPSRSFAKTRKNSTKKFFADLHNPTFSCYICPHDKLGVPNFKAEIIPFNLIRIIPA